MKFSSSYLLIFLVTVTLLITSAYAQVVEIPDPNLENAVREALELPAGETITKQDMLRLTRLKATKREIAGLTGLEHATNLKYLELAGNRISDLTPLANLMQLEGLALGWNQIQDISVLSNLIQLKHLSIYGNFITDYSPLDELSSTTIKRDVRCDFPHHTPIETRLQNRTFPAIFSAWSYHLQNRPGLSDTDYVALHDLHWHVSYFSFRPQVAPNGWQIAGDIEYTQPLRDELLALNPNLLFLLEIKFRDAWRGYYPDDFPYWLRDENGERIKNRPGTTFLTDFTQPDMQDIVVQQVIEVAKCGLFDGIFLDWFMEHSAVLQGQGIDGPEGYYSLEIEQQAKDTILQRIRASVRDDFLIIANHNRRKLPRRAWGINGTLMEVDVKWSNGKPNKYYTHEDIKEIESTLIWAEANLRAPQVNCLEPTSIVTEPPDSPKNKRWMRLFTTMSLTCSDGYVLYRKTNHHDHIWYDFWDADLGRPVGLKSQPYQNIDGLYIREYTNGWAVYNRSGKEQAVTLPRASIGVSSNKRDVTHLLPDLDGEIYLKAKNPADVNGDGRVNILDLVQVANGIGKSAPDLNGDGMVNILDLTLVAQQFSQ